jgi:2-amino-4-hydroxy-6-hydroxymethyldihydropteridine diphosphokinase
VSSEHPGSERIYLSLGSNLGNRREQLMRAVSYLAEILSSQRSSSLYETKPLYMLDQPTFLNMVVSGECDLSPRELLNAVLGIEARMGRNRRGGVPKGPRIIDIDILLYGQRIIEEEDLVIPHPLMTERQFVLIPLLELDEALRNPKTGQPLLRSLQSIEDQGVYIFSS